MGVRRTADAHPCFQACVIPGLTRNLPNGTRAARREATEEPKDDPESPERNTGRTARSDRGAEGLTRNLPNGTWILIGSGMEAPVAPLPNNVALDQASSIPANFSPDNSEW